MLNKFIKYPGNHGFTLIELIMVILLLGIIGVLGANFIGQSFKGFSESENRMEIYEEGKIALVRMEREIHNAIPNAFNLPVSTDIQFGMIDENLMRTVFGQYTNNNPNTWIRDRTGTLPLGSIISIYNLSWAHFSIANTPRNYEVTSIGGGGRMNVEENAPARNIQAGSPIRRFYAVDQAVRYCLDATNRLVRNSIAINNANYETGITFPGLCTGRPLATNISSLNFRYQPGSATNSPLVTVDFTISRNNESINFHKEITIPNVP